MPTNIVDSNAFTSPVVTPADGDPANAATFAATSQPLANRTYYLKQLTEVTGIKRVRGGSAAAMQALTGATTGDLFIVDGGGTLQGIYSYQSGSGATPDNSFVYAATGMGSGNWVHILFSLLNANLGLVGIGPVSAGSGISAAAADKILPDLIPYGVVQALYDTPSLGGLQHNATTTYADIPSFTINVPDTLTGDLLFVDMQLKVYDSTSHVGAWKAVAVDGVSTVDVDVPIRVGPSEFFTLSPSTFNGVYEVVTGGTVTLKGQFKTETSGGDCFADDSGGSRIRVLHIRP